MNEIKKAINAMHNLNMVLSITNEEKNAVKLAIQALQEKQQRDKIKCETCKYYAEFEGVCCNADSENCADFTSIDDYCGLYERRADNAE